MQTININSASGRECIIDAFYNLMDETRKAMPDISRRKARKEALIGISDKYNIDSRLVKRILKESRTW